MRPSDLDIVASCVDEIALEGLDGITLSAFWQRLHNRPRFPLNIDEASKSYLFEVVAVNQDVEFYELPSPRPPLVIFNRYDHIDQELGIVVEPEDLPEDIYPIKVIDENGIRGSCATYNERKNITDSIRCNDKPSVTLKEAEEKWGEKIVIVALQSVRNVALMGTEVDSQIELSPMQYCMLEKIGRTRYLGEVTQGKTGLATLNESPKTLHYYRKLLMKKRLITKQLHYQKNSNGQTASGSLLLLARFHVERQSKMQMMLQRMCETLEAKTNNMELFHKLRSELGMKETSFKKLFQNAFQKCVKTYMIPYKQMFPDAPDKEAFLQNGKERMVKICKLVRPYNSQEEDDEEEEGDDDDERIIGTHSSAFFHPNNFLQCKPLLGQAYDVVEAEGPEGITAQELGRRLGLPKLETRLLCRNLERRAVVMTIMQDMGRQRVTKYISKCHEHESEPHKKFLEERKRILEFQTQSLVENGKENASIKSADAMKQVSTPSSGASASQKSAKDGATALHQVPRTSFTDDLKRSFDHSRRDATHITYRVLKRANMIIEAVKTTKLIDELFKLQKLIIEKETEEGYHRKVDKKSVMRLVHRLAKDGYVRSIKTILRLGDQVKKLHFVCDPTITVDDPLVKSTIEQAKFKYFGASKEQTKKQSSPLDEEPRSIRHSVSKLRQLCKKGDGVARMQYIPCIGRDYGLLPKFLRAKTLHMFLFYLVYDYQGQEPDEQLHVWPKAYTDGKDWKMYVPPLPNHPGVAKGWCLISDILLSLPLSVLVKVVNITFRIEGLSEYLEDPVRCHYLVRHLPRKIRSALLYARRYIFAVYDVITRLSFMGLVSFGPQNHKEKDQVFVYIHKHTTIKDTTASQPGYLHVSPDISYIYKTYNLETLQDVETYWLNLEAVCLHTPLGSYSAARGQIIKVENLYTKPAMISASQNKMEEDVKDDGSIPGDGLGAGGLDSALFAHLKRNWTMSTYSAMRKRLGKNAGQTAKPPAQKPNDANKNYVKYLKDSTRVGGDRSSQNDNTQKRLQRLGNGQLSVHVSTVSRSRTETSGSTEQRPRQGKKRKLAGEPIPPASRKRQCITKVVQRKGLKRRRPYYDSVDKAALKRLKRQRVAWSHQEDSFLLVCKIASMVLDPKYNGLVVPCSVIRDRLHKQFPELSADKTSRACQRRIRYMLLNPETYSNVSIFLMEAKYDKTLLQMVPDKKPPKTKEAEWAKMFCDALDYLLVKFAKTKEPLQFELPNNLEEFCQKFIITAPKELSEDKLLHIEPKNIVDIHYNMVINIILSSLFAVADKNNWSYLLYKIYSQYPESMLKSVVARLRSSFIIAKLRDIAKRLSAVMPLWCLPCKLSVTYHNNLITRYQPEIINQCQELFQLLCGEDDKSSFPEVPIKSNLDPGSCCVIVELQGLSMLSFQIIVPEQVIIVDKELSLSSDKELREKMKRLAPSESSGTGDVELGKPSVENSALLSNVRFETITSSRTSRLALYLLRECSSEAHSQKVQNSQDYFMLNTCSLRCQIVENPKIVNTCERIADIPFDLKDVTPSLKIPDEKMEQIIASQKMYIPIDVQPVEDEMFTKKCETCGLSSQELQLCKKALSLITEKRELGISLKDLWYELGKCELIVFNSCTKFLLDNNIVSRVGVAEFRFVANWFLGPWLVHSFKIPRECKSLLKELFGHEQEARTECIEIAKPSTSTADDATDSGNGNTAEADVEGKTATDVSEQEPKEAEKTQTRSMKLRKKRRLADPSRRLINTEKWEKINFVGRIWRKPDGTFNRGVLLKFMTSVLSYIVAKPGVDQIHLCEKYNITMPPVHLLEILEMLEKLECIYRFYVRKSHKPSLFSAPAKVEVIEHGTPDEIPLFEPTASPFLRLAQFADKLIIKHIYLS